MKQRFEEIENQPGEAVQSDNVNRKDSTSLDNSDIITDEIDRKKRIGIQIWRIY